MLSTLEIRIIVKIKYSTDLCDKESTIYNIKLLDVNPNSSLRELKLYISIFSIERPFS